MFIEKNVKKRLTFVSSHVEIKFSYFLKQIFLFHIFIPRRIFSGFSFCGFKIIVKIFSKTPPPGFIIFFILKKLTSHLTFSFSYDFSLHFSSASSLNNFSKSFSYNILFICLTTSQTNNTRENPRESSIKRSKTETFT